MEEEEEKKVFEPGKEYYTKDELLSILPEYDDEAPDFGLSFDVVESVDVKVSPLFNNSTALVVTTTNGECVTGNDTKTIGESIRHLCEVLELSESDEFTLGSLKGMECNTVVDKDGEVIGIGSLNGDKVILFEELRKFFLAEADFAKAAAKKNALINPSVTPNSSDDEDDDGEED